MANTYTYDSYGNLTASSGSVPNPLSYTGRELDTETGLYYYRARYYDATGGRFVSEDPINFSAGVNFYRYVGNKAISLRDPTGKDPVIGATVGTVLGAVYFWDFLSPRKPIWLPLEQISRLTVQRRT